MKGRIDVRGGEFVKLLASASEQLRCEREGLMGHVPTELICGYCDDLFHPKDPVFISAFSARELKDLSVLYGLVYLAGGRSGISTVTELQKTSEWRQVMAFAKDQYEVRARTGPNRYRHDV